MSYCLEVIRSWEIFNSLKFSLGGPRLEDVRDGDGGVAVGEVGIVPSPRHGDSEPVAGNPG